MKFKLNLTLEFKLLIAFMSTIIVASITIYYAMPMDLKYEVIRRSPFWPIISIVIHLSEEHLWINIAGLIFCAILLALLNVYFGLLSLKFKLSGLPEVLRRISVALLAYPPIMHIVTLSIEELFSPLNFRAAGMSLIVFCIYGFNLSLWSTTLIIFSLAGKMREFNIKLAAWLINVSLAIMISLITYLNEMSEHAVAILTSSLIGTSIYLNSIQKFTENLFESNSA